MLKLRLKRIGRKSSPSYRLVIMENTSRRDGRPIEEVGYYNPISKKYKFDATKIKNELGWEPSIQSEEGLRLTVQWYLKNTEWLKNVTSGSYQKYYDEMYANRA